jgi:pimeloyl-ACP methyl ester carboxylesterase
MMHSTDNHVDPRTATSRRLPTARRVRLRSGELEVHDVGRGPPLLFVHGAMVSASIWAPLVERLAGRHRCIVPTLPLGSHRLAMDEDADLHPNAVADLLLELAVALELDAVHLVGNDSGGAVCQLAVARHPERIASLVLTNSDALEVFPPNAYLYLKYIASVPALGGAFAKVLHRFPRLGLLPLAWGSLARTIDARDVREWTEPLANDPGVRRDTAKFFRAADRRLMLEAATRLRAFEGPVTLAWGTRDPFFRLSLARRLAAHFADASVIEIEGARTYPMLDEPARVAAAIASHFERIRARS